MTLTLPRKLNVPNKSTTIIQELTMPPTKSLKLLPLLKLLDKEREHLRKILPLENNNLLCLMKKKLPLLPRERRIPKTSLPDKNKPNLSLMPLKLSSQNSNKSHLTPLLKPSWNLPNSVHPTQLLLLLKSLPPLTVKPLTDASDFLKNSKLISLNSLRKILKLKSKLRLTMTTY